MSTEYNGWRNVETWRVQLHIANDEHETRVVGKVAELYADGFKNGPNAGHWRNAYPERFADWVRQYVEERAGVTDTGGSAFAMFARDVVEAALQRVDWEQIAARWMESAKVDT